jgi:hypothetical protein
VSIVDEAETRAGEIRQSAEEDAAAQLQAARDAAWRVRERIDAIAAELGGMLAGIRRDSDALSVKRVASSDTSAMPLRTPLEGAATYPGASGAYEHAAPVVDHQPEVQDQPEVEPQPEVEHQPEVEPQPEVEEPAVAAPDETAGVADVQDAESVPDDRVEPVDATVVAGPDEVEEPAHRDDSARAEVVGLNDEQLARTYTHALAAAEGAGDDAEAVERWQNVAHAAVEEALGRPAFERNPSEPPTGAKRRLGVLRRRGPSEAVVKLREACRIARQRQRIGGLPTH